MKDIEIIVDCGILLGQSNKSIDQSCIYLKKFKTRKSKKDYLKNISKKVDSFLCINDNKLLEAFSKKNAKIYPIIPNSSQYVRDMNNYGLLVMNIRKILQLGFSSFSLMPTVIKNCFGILSNDFNSIITLLVDIEMVKFKKLKPKIVFLHTQMTDLFLANNNYEPIKSFENIIKKKYKAEPALFTNNLSLASEKLDEWNSKVKYICAPINPKGYMMKINKKEVEKHIKNTNRTIIGYNITCGNTIKFKDAIKYVKKLNVRKVVVSDFVVK